jgi:hypothetical protein
MTKEEVEILLEAQEWTFAKTMASIPHWYTHRENWTNDKDFCDVVQFIRDNGVTENFFNSSYVYYYSNGYKYWTMGNPLSYTDKKKTFILNRAKV